MEEAAIWDEIERSESYLVCSMHDEAASLASSIIQRIHNDDGVISKEDAGYDQLYDTLESAGMVLVQSLNELGRTPDILNELETLFGKIATIPVQVLLTGICLQISNGSVSDVRRSLEEFLSSWTYVDEGYYAIGDANANHLKKCILNRLDINVYMEVVELYTLTFLGTVLKDPDLAISWVEKAELPEERRQGLLRRLHSLFSPKATNVQQDSSLLPLQDDEDASYVKDPTKPEKTYQLRGENSANQAIFKFSRQETRSFWSLNPINIKCGKARLIISNGKIVLSLFVFILCYVLRRKRSALIRVLKGQLDYMKKSMVDLWQLAFSYQVNPLAAVQPLPSSTRGS